MELKDALLLSPFSKLSNNNSSAKKNKNEDYMLSLYANKTKNDNDYLIRSSNKEIPATNSRKKNLQRSPCLKSESAPKLKKVDITSYQDYISTSKASGENPFVLKSNFTAKDHSNQKFERIDDRSFFNEFDNLQNNEVLNENLNEDSEIIKKSFHRSFIIEKTDSDENSFILKNNNSYMNPASYIPTKSSYIPTKSSCNEKIDFQRLYLSSIEQMNELRRLHALEFETLQTKFEKVFSDFQKKQLEDFQRNQELTRNLEDLEKYVVENNKNYSDSIQSYESKTSELKSFVVILKERLEQQLEKRSDCFCNSYSSVQQENKSFAEKNKKLEQKLAYYEKYLFRSLKKMVEIFGILVLGEKPRIEKRSQLVKSSFDNKISANENITQISFDDGSCTIQTEKPKHSQEDTGSQLRNTLLKYFDKAATQLSKFNIDEDLYKIIDTYKINRDEAMKQSQFETTPRENFMESKTDDIIKATSKDTICMFANDHSQKSISMQNTGKSISMLSNISQQNFNPNKSEQEETIDEFRKYYIRESNKDFNLFYNPDNENKENIHPNITPFNSSPKKMIEKRKEDNNSSTRLSKILGCNNLKSNSLQYQKMPNILYPKPTVPNNTVINNDLFFIERPSLKKENDLLLRMVDNYNDENNQPKNKLNFNKHKNESVTPEKSQIHDKIFSRELFKSNEKDSFFTNNSIIFTKQSARKNFPKIKEMR